MREENTRRDLKNHPTTPGNCNFHSKLWTKHKGGKFGFRRWGGEWRNLPEFFLTLSLNYLPDPLQRGLYLQALASGIDNVLDKYLESIAKLEKDYLQNPSHSLLFIYHKVDTFQPLFSFLLKVVRDLKMQRLHGCAILQYLHQHMMHGDDQINKAVKM